MIRRKMWIAREFSSVNILTTGQKPAVICCPRFHLKKVMDQQIVFLVGKQRSVEKPPSSSRIHDATAY